MDVQLTPLVLGNTVERSPSPFLRKTSMGTTTEFKNTTGDPVPSDTSDDSVPSD